MLRLNKRKIMKSIIIIKRSQVTQMLARYFFSSILFLGRAVMMNSLINLKNVYQAAMVIIDTDVSLVKQHHVKDYPIFIEDLKKALDEYEKPFIKNGINAHLTKLEKYLSDLLKATQNMFNILNDEGKNGVENYLMMGKR